MKTFTTKQYINYGGRLCPLCQSPDITSEHVEADGPHGYANVRYKTCGSECPHGYANVRCKTCGSEWTDIWRVVGFDNLNEGMTAGVIKWIEAKAEMAIAERAATK